MQVKDAIKAFPQHDQFKEDINKLGKKSLLHIFANLTQFLRISFFLTAQFYGGQNHKKWNSLVEFKQLQGDSEPILKMPRIFPIRLRI